MDPLDIRYTPLAAAVLGDTRAAFEEWWRGYFIDANDGLTALDQLIMTAGEYQGRHFVGMPEQADDGTWFLLIDTATLNKHRLDKGPFAGKTVELAWPDSKNPHYPANDDEDDEHEPPAAS